MATHCLGLYGVRSLPNIPGARTVGKEQQTISNEPNYNYMHCVAQRKR